MTREKKRILTVGILLLAMLAALWGYFALAGRQSKDMGYLVRKTERYYCHG